MENRGMNRPNLRKVETIAFKADQALAQAMDELAKRQFRSRSDIVRQGVLKELEANGISPAAA
jgi:predicted transcriptional regulator